MQLISKVISFFDHLAFICCHPMYAVHDIKLDAYDVFHSAKCALVKMSDDFSGKTNGREDIAYMIERARISKSYRDSLASDHEPDEIHEQMMCYEPMIQKKAKMMMHPLGQIEDLSIDEFDFDTKRKMFFSALKYYESFYPDEIDRTKMIAKFYSCFCKSKSIVRAECLKASVNGDFDLEASLKQLL